MKRFIISLFIILLLTSCQQSTSTIPDKEYEIFNESTSLVVHFMDVGQGSATLFHLTEDENEYVILYDVGDWQRNDIVPYLEQQNIDAIDLIIVSHPHADHIGQLDKVVERFEVDEIWMSGNTTDSEVFIQAMEAILESDANYVEPRAGESYELGSLHLSVIHPENLTGDLNEDSLSIHFRFGQISFLLTGDASKNEELQMLERTDQIEAQILQLGHHGSNTSSDPKFIRAVNPEVAIYSAGVDNSYGHPHDEVIEYLSKENITVYGTDVDGTIIIETDGKKYDVKTTVKAMTENKSLNNENKMEDCIDINRASEELLMEIIHIGEVRAKELIELRPYDSVDELIKIDGIGPSKLADIKEEGKACVGGD